MVSSKRKLANISSFECEAGNPNPADNLKGSHDPVTQNPVVASVAESNSQRGDGDSRKEYSNIDGCIGAVLEHTESSLGLVRRLAQSQLTTTMIKSCQKLILSHRSQRERLKLSLFWN